MNTQSAENKENIKYIKSVSDFLNEINKIEEEKEENKIKENSLFYRGHSDQTYELKPSIYRDERFIENEDKIYRETISKVPYDFKGKNTIESLVLMQHYGVPTRILDLTTNPLVALYFACIENKDKDGEVVVFDIPEESTCYFDSDRITVLANLVKCKNDFYYHKDNFYSRHKIYLKELEKDFPPISYSIEAKKYTKIKNYVTKKINQYIKENDHFFLLSTKTIVNKFTNEKHIFFKDEKKDLFLLFIQEFKRKVKNLLWEKRLSINKEYFCDLLHFIKEDKSYFQDIINPDDIGSIFAIKPKLDNPRIVRQHGTFLIFGIQEYLPFSEKKIKFSKKMSEISPQWIKRGRTSNDKK